MSDELVNAVLVLRDRLHEEAHAHCVGVRVFVNHEGYEIEYLMRDPDALRRDGISMRNLRGDWVK